MQININNIATNYQKSGEGEAVLILPGWGATSAVYKLLSAQLSQKFCVYTLDLPGFGITPEPPTAWCVDDYTDFVIAFINALGIDKVTLIGHSYGGRIIIKLSGRQTDFKIYKIVLIDSAGIKSNLNQKQTSKQKRYKRLKNIYSKSFMKKLFPNALERLQKKYGSADYAAASPVMRQTLVKSINEDLSHLLSGISADTLLIWGKDDTSTPISDAVAMNNAIPGSKLVTVENAGHFPFIDKPFEFRKIIAEYFDLSL